MRDVFGSSRHPYAFASPPNDGKTKPPTPTPDRPEVSVPEDRESPFVQAGGLLNDLREKYPRHLYFARETPETPLHPERRFEHQTYTLDFEFTFYTMETARDERYGAYKLKTS